MDLDEVIRSYRQNPTREQIQIIAELWDTTPKRITKVLQKYGIIPRPKRRLQPKKYNLVEMQQRLKLLEFRCLTCPEKQKIYFDEMQELRRKINYRLAL